MFWIFNRYMRDSIRKRAMHEANGFKRINGKVVDVYGDIRPHMNYECHHFSIHSVLFMSIVTFLVELCWIGICEKLGISVSMDAFLRLGDKIVFFFGAMMFANEHKKILTNENAYLIKINRLVSGFYDSDERV